jgi:galactokinase
MNSQINCNTSMLIENLTTAVEIANEQRSKETLAVLPSCHLAVSIIESIKKIYGDAQEIMSKQIKRYLKLVTTFQEIYGDGAITIIRAPARINIIGEHIDYIKYFQTRVLPFGSREYDMLMAMRNRDDDCIRAATTAEGLAPKEFRIREVNLEKVPNLFKVHTTNRDEYWLEYLNAIGVPETSWDNYIKASAFYLQNMRPEMDLKGMDILIDSTIPIAGGASSSSALVVVSGVGLRLANNLNIDKDELADSSSKAEWYVGTRGGKMDHATMCFAELSKALLITFEPFSAQPIPIPAKGYKWITFYTQPADKGSKVMSEYNERSIVSRLLIPILLENILIENPTLNESWKQVLGAIKTGDVELIENNNEVINQVIDLLPETMTLNEVKTRFPKLYGEAKGLYPVLFEVRGEESKLKIRDRAKHHLGEITRVLKAAEMLKAAAEAKNKTLESELMRKVGQLMYETHDSLRDLYEISTDDMNKVVDIAKSVRGAYGARVMGGGFGGNVLALVEDESVSELIEKVEKEYYAPQGRNGLKENSILISTPGDGVMTEIRLRRCPIRESARQMLINQTNDWKNWEDNEPKIMNLAADLLGGFQPIRPIKPIIVAAGKGQRAKDSGIEIPKPLVEIAGKPAIMYVLDTVLSIPNIEKPIIVVSPESEPAIRTALSAQYDADYVIQKEAKGTGHAVYQAKDKLQDFDGDVIVIWGTQPVIKSQTVRKSIMIHQAVGNSAMTFPTTKHEHPYAPLIRDDKSKVIDSRETHLEGAETVDYGEDNIGVFCLKSNDLFDGLDLAHTKALDSITGEYKTPKGELGFPNQMVRTLASQGKMVLGLAMADPREAKGIKVADDIAVIEGYLRET